VKGKVIEVSRGSLAVSVDGRRQDFNLSGVTRVERERRATKKGALIGFLAGAGGLATTFGLISEKNCGGTIHACEDEWALATVVAVFGGFGGGMGAAVGAAIGATLKHRETVFAASPPTRLSLTPFIDRRHRGMALSIRF